MKLLKFKCVKQFFAGLFLITCAIAYSQDINISGKILGYASGNGIHGASVKLVNKNITVTTDANGNYQIINSSSIHSDIQNPAGLVYSNSLLSFTIETDQKVNISVYNMAGQLVEFVVNDYLSSGYYDYTLGEEYTDYGVYVIKFASEKIVGAYKLSGNSLQSVGGGFLSAKSAALGVDNISVSANGYTARTLALRDYQESGLDIVLFEEADEPPVDPPVEYDGPSTLTANSRLNLGEFLVSPNKQYAFGLNADGNVVLLKGIALMWSANVSGGAYLILQGDGNFIAKNASGAGIWKSKTDVDANTVVSINDNGVVAVKLGNTTKWSIEPDFNLDECPQDANKVDAGLCGCGVEEGSCVYTTCNGAEFLSGGTLEAGPIVGHTTNTSSKIWVSAPGSVAKIVYYPTDCSKTAVTKTMTKVGTRGFAIEEITGLSADTEYEYLILVDNKVASSRTFTTAPTPNQPVEFRYVFGSGTKISNPNQPAWTDILEKVHPDFMIFGGDNVYPNSTKYDEIWRHHRIQRTQTPNYAEAISIYPTWAIWDDHDYADNNSHSAAVGKETSLQCFKEVWANGSYGEPNSPGIYSTFMWGDVEFYLMDNRYNMVKGSKYFGDKQIAWLKNKLRNSTATFKVIVHGGTVRRAGDESWSGAPLELNDFLNFIKTNNIAGVILNGGDVHQLIHNHYPKNPDGGNNHYDIFEIVSSAWSYSNKHMYAQVDVNTKLANPTITYTFHARGKVVQKGVYTLLDDGRMRHDYISGKTFNVETSDGVAEPDPAFAFPE